MPEETNHQHRVTVSKDSVHASSEPRFIVQVGDCYYVTLAVWEYDPAKATSDQHQDALRQVADAFSAGNKVQAASTIRRRPPRWRCSPAASPIPRPASTECR